MKYHFIGIKGSGMSSLAQILHDLGNDVQGSDLEETFFTQVPLEKRNILLLPFQKENIQPHMTIIAGNAFKDSHVEIQACIKQGIPFIRYHKFLKQLMKQYISIAVSGAHGKTSTTGLLAHVLGSVTPTSYLIGDGTGYGKKDSTHFVFEACEYRRHFLAYSPKYAIVTNIDFDHPDYFTGIQDVKEAFQSFSDQVGEKIIACGDDAGVKETVFHQETLYYGLEETNQLRAVNIRTSEKGTTFDVRFEQNMMGTFTIPMFGDHQIKNTLAVIAVCLLEGFHAEQIKEFFLTYPGVKRRFTETKIGTNVLIDDYAHHPTEIKATIDSVKQKYPTKQIVAIFQPHTFSRTKEFLTEFAHSLEEANTVYLVDIFGSAREKNGDLTIHDVIRKTKNAHYLSEENIEILAPYENAVLVFMGAGDIQKIEKAYERKKALV